MITIFSEAACKIKENNGFLKYVCNGSNRKVTKHKCIKSEEYYCKDSGPGPYYLSGKVCSNDPFFYQACDNKIGGQITNNQLLCEHFICQNHDLIVTSPELKEGDMCTYDCSNTELNKEGCTEETAILPTGKTLRPAEICDGKCNYLKGCEDEAICNGYRYGLFCKNHFWLGSKLRYVPPHSICDGWFNCQYGEDEANCSVTDDTETFCERTHSYLKLVKVPVHNYTRCTDIDHSHYNENYNYYCRLSDIVKYQTNCSDPSRVGLTCEINGYKSTLSKYMICFDCFSGLLINYIFLRFNFSSRRFSPILFRTRATGYKVFVKCENIEVNFRMMNDP